jgi:transposase, IS30 family
MKYKHLSIEERELLQTLWWERGSIRKMARVLGRSPATISRELRRNLPPERKVYTPRLAHERALKSRKSRGRKERLRNKEIRAYVIEKLKLRWSPEQIAGRIKLDIGENISHETIYQYIYHTESYGNVKGEDLRIYLRRRRKRRQPKGARKYQRIFKPEGVSIELRPEIVNQRLRIGDWEGDTVESKNHKPGINTLVERKLGLTLITKLKTKTSFSTMSAVSERMRELPKELKHTITLDNGPENRDWKTLEELSGLSVFYAHPYCSGERGTNENTNGLIRDYYPKGTDFTKITDEELAYVELMLNERPRKRLNWLSPLEALSVALGS